MSERRRFNTSERVALYLAADGKCSECGRLLEPGWHSDHEQPWSKGGLTDVVNGQALCPDCNLKKGDQIVGFYAWQEDALEKFITSEHDFLCVATPAAGKTRFSLAGAQQLFQAGRISRLVVVVPTDHLRIQWAKAAHKHFGIQLAAVFKHRDGTVARDYDGLVTTYSAVGTQPLIYRRYVTEAPTLVILDEIHHAGEQRTWGDSLKLAFERAARRLLLSGTPFRTDGGAIAFVRTGSDGFSAADYTYTYGEALTDQIVRPIAFAAFDGNMRWRSAGEITAIDLSKTDDETSARALAVALDPEGEWIASVLQQADAELSRQRETMPDAGGLVIAANQFKAGRYKTMLERICGEPVTLAISDEPDASSRITQFTEGRTRWIVAVQMVSEGVDIPRLAVGVYASDYRTELFFKQVVGRFVRLRDEEDETCATLFIPSVEPILTYAKEIEKLVPRAIREAEERARLAAKAAAEQLHLNLVEPPAWEPAGSSEAIHYATILSGEALTDDELHHAESLLKLGVMPSSVTAAQVARLLRMAGMGRVVGTAQVQMPPPVALADQKKPLRKLVNGKVNQLARQRDTPQRFIHADLNRACGDTVPTATVDTLNQRLVFLDQWLAES